MPDRLFAAAAAKLGPVPLVLATASGVLTERGEHEGVSAVAGVTWRGGSVAPLFVASDAGPESVGVRLAEQARAALGDTAGTIVLFAQPQSLSTQALIQLSRAAPRATVIGGGTLSRGAFAAAPSGKAALGAVVGLVLKGLARPAVRSAPACRLLAPLAPVTEARGPMALRLGDQPALDRLASSASSLTGRPLVLAVLARDSTSAAAGSMLVRGIRGVDPARKGVVVTDEIGAGMLMTYAVCDPAASRASLAASVRDVERQLAGGAPQFGLLLTCASRGRALYGEPGVDSGIVRERFPHVPFAGMFSSFEIAPFEERAAMHFYTGVLAVFGAPS
jgi:small ligand-binding sensory domain FIST